MSFSRSIKDIGSVVTEGKHLPINGFLRKAMGVPHLKHSVNFKGINCNSVVGSLAV